MKLKILASLPLILATAALAQAPNVKPADRVESKRPEKTINSDLVAKFFKAQAKALSDQKAVEVTPQFQAAQLSANKFQLIIQEMTKFCGADYNLMIDNKTEDPACAPIEKKTEAPKDKK